MQEHVFQPYGMKMSSYTWQPRFEEEYAVGHTSVGWQALPEGKGQRSSRAEHARDDDR